MLIKNITNLINFKQKIKFNIILNLILNKKHKNKKNELLILKTNLKYMKIILFLNFLTIFLKILFSKKNIIKL